MRNNQLGTFGFINSEPDEGLQGARIARLRQRTRPQFSPDHAFRQELRMIFNSLRDDQGFRTGAACAGRAPWRELRAVGNLA